MDEDYRTALLRSFGGGTYGARDLHGDVLEGDRLHEERVGADLREPLPFAGPTSRGHHDDRRLIGRVEGAEVRSEPHSVHLRHLEIDEHHGVRVLLERRDGLLAVADEIDHRVGKARL